MTPFPSKRHARAAICACLVFFLACLPAVIAASAPADEFGDWAKERRAFLNAHAFFSKLPDTTFVEAPPFLLHVSGPALVGQIVRDEITPLIEDQRRYFETTVVQPGRLKRRAGFEGFTISVISDRKAFERFFADRQFEMRAEGLVARYDHRNHILVLCTDGTGTRLSPELQRHQTLMESGRFLLDAYSPRGIISVIAHWQRLGIPDHLAEARPIQVAGRTRFELGNLSPTRLADFFVGLSGNRPLIPLGELVRILDDWSLEGTTREATRDVMAKDRRLANASATLLRWGPAAYHTFVGFLLSNEPWKSRYLGALPEMLSAEYTSDRLFAILEAEPPALEKAWLEWVATQPEAKAGRAAADQVLSAAPPVSQAANTQVDPFTVLRKRKEEGSAPPAKEKARTSKTEQLASAVRALRAGDTGRYLQIAGGLGGEHRALADRIQAFRERFLTAIVKQSELLELELADGSEVRGTVTAREGDDLLLDLRGGGQKRVPTSTVTWEQLVVQSRSRLRWREGDDYVDSAAVRLALGDPDQAGKLRSSASRKSADLSILDAVWDDYVQATAAVSLEDRLAEVQGDPAALVELFESVAAEAGSRDVVALYLARHRSDLEQAYRSLFDPTPVIAGLLRGQVEKGERPGTVRVRYDFSSLEQIEDWHAHGSAHLVTGWDVDFSGRSSIHEFQVEGGHMVSDRVGYVRHALRLVGPASLEWNGRFDELDDTSEDLLMLAFYGILCDDGTAGDFYAFSDGRLLKLRKGHWRGKSQRIHRGTIGNQFHSRLEWTGDRLIGVRDKRHRIELAASGYQNGHAGFFVYGDFRYYVDDVVIEGHPDPKLIEGPLAEWVAARMGELSQ